MKPLRSISCKHNSNQLCVNLEITVTFFIIFNFFSIYQSEHFFYITHNVTNITWLQSRYFMCDYVSSYVSENFFVQVVWQAAANVWKQVVGAFFRAELAGFYSLFADSLFFLVFSFPFLSVRHIRPSTTLHIIISKNGFQVYEAWQDWYVISVISVISWLTAFGWIVLMSL